MADCKLLTAALAQAMSWLLILLAEIAATLGDVRAVAVCRIDEAAAPQQPIDEIEHDHSDCGK
jgi:hypothetical protein